MVRRRLRSGDVERHPQLHGGSRGARRPTYEDEVDAVGDPRSDHARWTAFGYGRLRCSRRQFGIMADKRRVGYMFTDDPTCDRVASRHRKRSIDKARSAVGLDDVRLHDLRHFQATQLLDAGVPVPTVAARLGHADGTTTMRIYAHRTRRADQQAADVVARLLD